MGYVNFFELIGPGGKPGARERFEALIAQLVRLEFGNAAMRLEGRGGDWGLDTIVGDLGDGTIEAFQAKFFIDGVGPAQHAQIRRSFDAAIAGRDHGHELAAWTLCVPVCLDPESARWWAGWKRRAEGKFGIRIDLWDATVLEALLLEPAAADIKWAYFPRTFGPVEMARRRLEGVRSQVREIAPTKLRDRDEELEELVRFATGEERYLHLVAPPWAGKTALVSSFVLDPPDGVDVASFFVTAGLAEHNDSQAFVVAMTGQLAALADEPPAPAGTGGELDVGEYLRLLEQAAARARADGRRLVLAVDGLDEDESLEGGRDLPSIASLLPRAPIPGLAVLVSSRPHPDIPADTHPEHPLRGAHRLTIDPSPHAAESGRLAEHELMGHLSREEAAFDLIGCLCAAEDGLGIAELAEVTGRPRHRVKSVVARFFGRSLIQREAVAGEEPVLFFAHAALRDSARDLVADQIEFWQSRLDAWADSYRAEGWPATTPRYLVWSYAQALAERRELGRMTRLACDARRADLLAERTGGDGRALEELLAVERAVREDADADLLALTRLAVHRMRLTRRSHDLPDSLPALWAALGDLDRAGRTADAMQWFERNRSLEAAVSTLISMRRWADTERLIASLSAYERDKGAKSLVDGLIAADRLDLVEQAKDIIGDDGRREAAAVSIAEARFGIHAEAEEWDECEKIARGFGDKASRLRLLCRLARLVAPTDGSRAERLAQEPFELLDSDRATHARDPEVEVELVETSWRLGRSDAAERLAFEPRTKPKVKARFMRAVAKDDPELALRLLEPECDAPTRRQADLTEALARAAIYADRQERPRTLGRQLAEEVVEALRDHGEYVPPPRVEGDQMLLHTALSSLRELGAPPSPTLHFRLTEACMAARDWGNLGGLLARYGTDGARRRSGTDGALSTETALAQARRGASWLDSTAPELHLAEMAAALAEHEDPSPKDQMIIHVCRGEWALAEEKAPLHQMPGFLRQLCLWRGLDSAWDDALRISERLGVYEVGVRAELAQLMAADGEIDRAERVADALPRSHRERALAAIATEVSKVRGAESSATRLAKRLRDPYDRAELLALMASSAPCANDQDWAEDAYRMAMDLPGDTFRARLLATLAESTTVETSIGREALLAEAIDLAHSLSNPRQQGEVLARLALASREDEPDRAVELAVTAAPLIDHADPKAAEAVAEVLALGGHWDDAEKAMMRLGEFQRSGTQSRLARIAIRQDLQLALVLCNPGIGPRSWAEVQSDERSAEAPAAVAIALCRHGRGEAAADLLARHPARARAAILTLEAPDPEIDPLVEIATRLIDSLAVYRDEARKDLVHALVAGGRYRAAEAEVRAASGWHRGELEAFLAGALLSTERSVEALSWGRKAAEQGDSRRQEVVLAFADAGRIDDALELLGKEEPSREIGTSIARGLAVGGFLDRAEEMIGRLPTRERARARAAVGLALAPSHPEEACRFALLVESEAIRREPLAGLVSLVAVELPPSELRHRLVARASNFERAHFTAGFALLLYQGGYRVAAGAHLPDALRDRRGRVELEGIAGHEVDRAGSEPGAVVERLAEMAFAEDDPYRSALALCAFAAKFAAREESRAAARLLVDRAVQVLPEVDPDRAAWVLLYAAEAIAPADAGLASSLLCRAAPAVRYDVRKRGRSRAVARLADIMAEVHGVAAAESAVLAFDAADRGRALAMLTERPRESGSMSWDCLVACAERAAEDAADAEARSEVLTLLACTVAGDDPERASRLASAAIYDDEDWRPMTDLVVEFLMRGMDGEAWKVMGHLPSPWNDDFPMLCDSAVRFSIDRGDWRRAEEIVLGDRRGNGALETYMNALGQAGRWETLTRLEDQIEGASAVDPLLMAAARAQPSTSAHGEGYRGSAEAREQWARLLRNEGWESKIWLLDRIDGRLTRVIAEEALQIVEEDARLTSRS